MSTESPLNAKESAPDSPIEAQEYDPINPKHSHPLDPIQDLAKDKPTDGFPPLPFSGTSIPNKGKGRKRKGKKKKTGKRNAAKPLAILPHPENKSQSLALGHDTATQSQAGGEEGFRRVGPDGIGLHWQANKNVDQKEPAFETEPVEGVEDVSLDEVQTRAAVYAKVKAVWEQAGDICVRVYARPLNPRLVLVEWEGEDGVEKHGKIVVNERQRGMFGPGKVVWVRGPLVGDRWLLAGKYNFLGNRVS